MVIDELALTFVPNLGSRGISHLMEIYGSAKEVYAQPEHNLLLCAELRRDIAMRISQKEGYKEAERELRYCEDKGITVTSYNDDLYPRLLGEVADRPHIIYSVGDLESLQSPHILSVVGTRRITPYGESVCAKIIPELAEMFPDLVVVSGLAFGVDGACHLAAIACEATTVAVLANPLPEIAPSAHERMAAEFISRGGAIVSELSSQTKQNGRYFIPRNRIIAGMSAGTVVVESPESGGSLSTAAFADGYNRTVMAVPGRVTDSNSRGCNLLICNRKAQIVLSGRDIANELMWDLELDAVEEPPREQLPLTDDESRLLALFDSEPVTIDALQQRSGLSLGELSLTLMNLELSGVIRPLPGKRYEKII